MDSQTAAIPRARRPGSAINCRLCSFASVPYGKIAVRCPYSSRVQGRPSTGPLFAESMAEADTVTNWLVEEPVERLLRWNLHPAAIITHRSPLQRAGEAYARMASGKCGKVAVSAGEKLQ
jgi:hypothetical protein